MCSCRGNCIPATKCDSKFRGVYGRPHNHDEFGEQRKWNKFDSGHSCNPAPSFWTDKGESVDLAYEKQGISRAYRFGLNHPLKIVRFAVRGTVEEEITLRRQNIKY